MVEDTISARGSWRSTAVLDRAPRRVHLDQVVERIAAAQAVRGAAADGHHGGGCAGPPQLLEQHLVGHAPAERGAERHQQDVRPGHSQPPPRTRARSRRPSPRRSKRSRWRRRPAAPISRARSGSAASASSARADRLRVPAPAPGGRSRRPRPARRSRPTSVATTGRSSAIASRMLIGSASASLGRHRAFAPRISSSTSRRTPRSVTPLPSASRSSRSRSGPSPAT